MNKVSKNLSACLLFDHLYNQNQKPFETKFARLAARAVIGSLFLLKKQQIYYFLAGNNYPDSPHLQRGMKLSTQVSPLLNLKLYFKQGTICAKPGCMSDEVKSKISKSKWDICCCNNLICYLIK